MGRQKKGGGEEEKGARTVDAVEPRGFYQASRRARKVVAQDGAGCHDREHLARAAPANRQDYLQVRVLLLQVHQRAQSALGGIVARRSTVRPLVAELRGAVST